MSSVAAPAARSGREVAMHNLAVDRVTREVVAAFRERGIESVLLKGPTTERWLYDDGTPRRYGDTDLLVHPDRFREAAGVLEGLGFVDVHAGFWPSERAPHADTFVRPAARGGGAVDLHHNLVLSRVPGHVTWDVLNRHTEVFELGGVEVLGLDIPARCVLLALHAVQHGMNEPQPMEDLARALSSAPVTTWDTGARVAAELGADCAYVLGVAIGRHDDEIPWSAVDPLTRARTMGLGSPSLALARLMATSRRTRLAVVLKLLWPSSAKLRHSFPQMEGTAAQRLAHLLRTARRLTLACSGLRLASRRARQNRALNARVRLNSVQTQLESGGPVTVPTRT